MKLKKEYAVRDIASEHIVVIQGNLDADMTRVIALNDSGAHLWRELEGKDFTAQDAAQVLYDNYQVDRQTALADAGKWIEALKQCQAIED